MQEALQARSYKKEVILMVSGPERIDSFLQAANSIHGLGFGHIMLLGLSEDDCKIVNQTVPAIGCGWTSFKTPQDLSTLFALWSLRYRTLARCVSAHKPDGKSEGWV